MSLENEIFKAETEFREFLNQGIKGSRSEYEWFEEQFSIFLKSHEARLITDLIYQDDSLLGYIGLVKQGIKGPHGPIHSTSESIANTLEQLPALKDQVQRDTQLDYLYDDHGGLKPRVVDFMIAQYTKPSVILSVAYELMGWLDATMDGEMSDIGGQLIEKFSPMLNSPDIAIHIYYAVLSRAFIRRYLEKTDLTVFS